ncbi:NmrA/HSCARG family protein [Rugosimonospora africana]|uniref:NmrA family transcriptional regulator n=1 Tax=Rugosimonospora africana TaxID=556532 RepID=A0A8J3QPX3_9ACTN|nr:NmrA/HSCARG family protein [Rugosimonospora africana]GIH14314.1 NmrA family transcriptional regulator [Rugosimonospora africana]
MADPTESTSVLVIGATGQQGSAVTRSLLARGLAVHALVRDTERPAARELRASGARLVLGDLDDPESLSAAMAGVSGVFAVLTMMMNGPTITPEGIATEERRGTTVAEVAAKTGVGHLVYSSVAGASTESTVAHLRSKATIEARIRSLGLPATILRPVSFMENFTTYATPVVTDGTLVVSLAMRPDSPMQLIAVRDIGEFAAIAFGRPEEFTGQTMVIAGDRLPGTAIAERFGRARGVPARFQPVPIERLRAFDEEVARMFEWLDSGDGELADLSALRAVHPQLMTLADWLDGRETETR